MAAHELVFFVLLVFLPTQLGYHWWPNWSYVFGRRIDYLSPTLYVTDLLLILLLFLVFIQKWKQIPWKGAGVLFVFALANSAVSFIPLASGIAWVRVLSLVFLGWYVASVRPSRSILTAGLVTGAMYSSVLAVLQYSAGHSLDGLAWWFGERHFTLSTPGIATMSWCLFPITFSCPQTLRAYATFSHPNVLGGFLAAILPLVVTVRRFWVRVAVYVFCLIGLFVTLSRSAWVVAFGGILGAVLVHKHIFRSRYIVVLVAVCCIGSFLLFPSFSDESVRDRIRLFQSAVELWQHSPLVGVGLNTFIPSGAHVLAGRFPSILQPVHSLYALLLSETGFIGFSLFCLLLYRSLKAKWSVYTVSFCSFLLLSLVDHYAATSQQGRLLLAILFGLVLQ